MENAINTEGKWKVLKSEYLIKRPWLTARKDFIELPDGRQNDEYYVLEYPDWVNVIAITEEGKFVMERQYRHGLGNTCYELPCGVIEPGEDPLEAAKRELQEETGFGGGEWTKMMHLAPNPGSQNNLSHCFVATGVKKMYEQKFDATEDISVHLLTVEQIKDLLQNGQIIQALMAAPLWRYFAENGLI